MVLFIIYIALAAIILFVIGYVITRVVIKAQTIEQGRFNEILQARMFEVNKQYLSDEQIRKARSWYDDHRGHVNKLIMSADWSYPPTQAEDKNNPNQWKAEYWKWFVEEILES
jgi:uncharacterized protein YneF (UPF0154 family)